MASARVGPEAMASRCGWSNGHENSHARVCNERVFSEGWRGSERYCVLHLQSRYKSAPFFRALETKLHAGDLDFEGFWFPSFDDAPPDLRRSLKFRLDFGGNANFSGATFSGKASFFGCTFGGETDFSGATFEDGADFSRATFEGIANFADASFNAEASFRAVTFREEADFSWCDFGRSAYFFGANFFDSASFHKTQFGRRADFSGSILGGDTDFSHAVFSKEAYFRETLLRGAARFSAGTFCDAGDFTNAVFGHGARFDSATFAERAYFSDAEFKRGCGCFSYAAFEGQADFERTKFGGAEYEQAVFGGPANFREATLGEASFSEATFRGHADFGEARFRTTDFSEATFEDSACFSNAAFEQRVAFRGSHFRAAVEFVCPAGPESSGCLPLDLEFLDLEFARLDNPHLLSFHSVRLRPSWFVNVDAREIDFASVTWYGLTPATPGYAERPQAEKAGVIGKVERATRYIFDRTTETALERELEYLKGHIRSQNERERKRDGKREASGEHRDERVAHGLMAEACRDLAHNLEAHQRYDEASNARFWSMEAARKEHANPLRSDPAKTLYRWLSGYGESPRHALYVLLATWVFFALAYLMVGTAEALIGSETPGQANSFALQPDTGFVAAVLGALGYSLGAMTFQVQDGLKETIGLFPSIVYLEGVVGPLQIALLGLALRRKFMTA